MESTHHMSGMTIQEKKRFPLLSHLDDANYGLYQKFHDSLAADLAPDSFDDMGVVVVTVAGPTMSSKSTFIGEEIERIKAQVRGVKHHHHPLGRSISICQDMGLIDQSSRFTHRGYANISSVHTDVIFLAAEYLEGVLWNESVYFTRTLGPGGYIGVERGGLSGLIKITRVFRGSRLVVLATEEKIREEEAAYRTEIIQNSVQEIPKIAEEGGIAEHGDPSLVYDMILHSGDKVVKEKIDQDLTRVAYWLVTNGLLESGAPLSSLGEFRMYYRQSPQAWLNFLKGQFYPYNFRIIFGKEDESYGYIFSNPFDERTVPKVLRGQVRRSVTRQHYRETLAKCGVISALEKKSADDAYLRRRLEEFKIIP